MRLDRIDTAIMVVQPTGDINSLTLCSESLPCFDGILFLLRSIDNTAFGTMHFLEFL